MASNYTRTRIQELGTQASPITVTGGGTKTWTHNRGQKALVVEVMHPTDGYLIPNATIGVTQPTTNTIVFTNPGSTASIVARAHFGTPSESKASVITAATLT